MDKPESKTAPANVLAKLKDDYEKQVAKVIGKVKEELADKFSELNDIYQTLPPETRSTIYSEPAFEGLLKSLGLSPLTDEMPKAKSARKPRTTKGKVTDEAILAFLVSEKTTGDVQHEFDLSSVTVGKKLKELEAAKKITVKKDGVKKLWKKV